MLVCGYVVIAFAAAKIRIEREKVLALSLVSFMPKSVGVAK
jgi:hypothetical protein